jgi:hypothetical protein
VSILDSTAASTGGKCIPCSRGTRAQMEANRRRGDAHRERLRKNEEARKRIAARPHATFADFLAEEDPIGVLWGVMLTTVSGGSSRLENIGALSASARTLYYVEIFNGEVLNGGFSQFFSNSSGEYAHEALAALQELGAPRAAGLLQQAMAAFPGGRVPPQRRSRYEQLERIDPAVLDALDTEYYTLEKSSGEGLARLMLAFMKNRASERIT